MSSGLIAFALFVLIIEVVDHNKRLHKSTSSAETDLPGKPFWDQTIV